MIRNFLWRRDKSLPLTLSITCKKAFGDRVDVCATIRAKKTSIASVNGLYYNNNLKIFTFANHLRMDMKTRRVIPKEKKLLFRHIGAWLLQKLLCFLFPSKISQKEVCVSLIADGWFLDDENAVVRNHPKLVAYYEKLGFQNAEIDFERHESLMESSANVIVNKIKLLK